MEDNIVQIDLNEIARLMKRKGIKARNIRRDDFTGWTDTIMDSLEDECQLETKLREYFK